jgi:hypothetical protein
MILFLDFEGVVHEYGGKPIDLSVRGPLLEAWLLRHPNADVVITSTLRLTRPIEEIRGFFSQACRERIVGVTPKINGALPERFPREVEINLWFRRSAEPWQEWVALDEQARLFMPFNDRAVLCDPDVGLTEVELAQLSALVSGRG